MKLIEQKSNWQRILVSLLVLSATAAWCIDPPAIQTARLKASSGLPPSIVQAINPNGILLYTYWGEKKMRIFEVFEAKSIETRSARSDNDDALFSNVQPGALVGVIHLLPEAHSDYREDS